MTAIPMPGFSSSDLHLSSPVLAILNLLSALVVEALAPFANRRPVWFEGTGEKSKKISTSRGPAQATMVRAHDVDAREIAELKQMVAARRTPDPITPVCHLLSRAYVSGTHSHR